MQELLENILNYLRGIWLKRRYILIISWIVCPIGWIAVTMMPDQYTSNARVYADTRSILQPLLSGLAIQTDPTQELNLMAKTLLNRNNLEKIARETDSDIIAKTKDEYNQAIADLKSNINIGSTNRENLYKISYSGDDPEYAKSVVQAALNVFVENVLGDKRLDTEQARQIITSQIEDYEARLIDAERKLADFKREYTGFMPGADSSYYNQLESQKTQLEDAEFALNEARTRMASAKSQLAREKEYALNHISAVRTEYDERIDSLQLRLDDLTFRFTEKHPDIIETRRQLNELKQLKSRTLANMSVNDSLVNYPVYQELKVTINQLENEIATLEVRIDRHNTKMVELKNKLDMVPDVEAKLISLTRSYDVTKGKYNQLLSRRESALISESVGASSEDIKFRVIDPPNLPSSASGPNRPLLLVAVLVVGIGSGIGVSFLVSQLMPVVSSTNQLYRITGVPVFGVVSATEESGLLTKEKRKKLSFVILNILLVVAFMGAVMVNKNPALQQFIK
ncbi:chain length determinant family protein [Photobacterium sp. BZF1]|uniref:XrtA system polysaccharide chain length determinant n=1 Tax=Photobacterium sp. BZF1 TaxID=1904457 RepID=UPI001653EB1C|nr:XrtA system polysaccharide chain length determinant [Photobacterium sp. BZF1]MBC7004733.1 chain length determinant family protein [Photobacterium sp. BZF1]